MNNLTWQDFNPFNTWELKDSSTDQNNASSLEAGKANPFQGAIASTDPSLIRDQWLHATKDSKDRRYLAESDGLIRFKCGLLVLGTPIAITAKAICQSAWRLLKVLTLSSFWRCRDLSISDRVKNTGKDLAKIITAPFALIGLQFAALYGLISPKNGRKLYASIEKGAFGPQYLLAPCFQPNPRKHLGLITVGDTTI